MKAIIVATALFSAASLADGNAYYDYAKVESVEAVYETVQIQGSPNTVCYSKPYTQVTYEQHQSATPTILGAIIGGAIGNAVGHNKTNKKVGMVAGAALGGAIGHDIGKTSSGYGTREVCESRPQTVSYQQVLKGYHVGYRFKGERFYTFLKRHPGDKIKVRVNVSPVIY
ncbi:glycine zipper 2TM domain-containing protein [Aliiglaciecola sp. CAU 1673]|uniref:glycine zipper 2TM domain-containing protein n=1 Tax=Aliiglaciecola sp. CAU 1673 TaxID=3032595 RepID=UPI0023DC955A|nr:glycine zipper 2TM domain-containing protein [Aliiglaciecola sp. CAU 1673]MDF2178818.1 glycine zipper 2TM domain-containing protein [Aliiglaciecola sp. CAU 1673]